MAKVDIKVLLDIARALFEEAERMKPGDLKVATAVHEIAQALEPLCQPHKELYGLMYEIQLWVGLKHDSPQLAVDWKYGEGIKADFPAVFKAK